MAWRHYSGLIRVFCSLEQNVWNTFYVFRNWNSVSIERLFGFIPFILIPELGQSNAALVFINVQQLNNTVSFFFFLQFAPFPLRFFEKDQALILHSQITRQFNHSKQLVILFNVCRRNFIFLTPRYYGLSLLRTLNDSPNVSAITRVDWRINWYKLSH